ncbi:hypothetical protein R3X27_20175 [Tropicimonas sp. TH_r6]|uniref:hypothetical protein n=1 Tax=Tropicimonas sp. TH_r6 TaxID=3082085 RepID=UPI0029536384|nr:hypothetical protein [Tropicimonas sp. TH_r6]MDV7145003.1 hypothetical protein [Tropicimonas sp. TH_r6]
MENIFLLGGGILSLGAWGMASWVSLSPIQNEANLAENLDWVAPDENLVASYQRCSRDAEIRMLPFVEARNCSQSYLELKLSLLPDVGYTEFGSLPAVEQREIEKRGYSAFLSWKENDAGTGHSGLAYRVAPEPRSTEKPDNQ